MRVGIDSLPQFGIFNTENEYKSHTVYSETLEQIKTLQLICQVAEFKFESTFEPVLVSWHKIPKATLEHNQRF